MSVWFHSFWLSTTNLSICMFAPNNLKMLSIAYRGSTVTHPQSSSSFLCLLTIETKNVFENYTIHFQSVFIYLYLHCWHCTSFGILKKIVCFHRIEYISTELIWLFKQIFSLESILQLTRPEFSSNLVALLNVEWHCGYFELSGMCVCVCVMVFAFKIN